MNFSTLPSSIDDMTFGDAYFSLFTRNNSDKPEMLTVPDSNTKFDSVYLEDLKPLVAVTHGWLSDDKTRWIQAIKDSLLRKTDMNVITVDWSEISKTPAYPWAALSTRYVGKKLAKLLDAITGSYNIEGKDMYLVGHSLGAHVMGYTGMFSNQKIQRITGLDPARPLFEVPLMPPDFRLEQSDAEFVDIIHSCGGILGYKESHGHADFYPNNGRSPQPGCEGILEKIQGCSHGRACLYFEESIEYDSGGFVAYPCQDWQLEGNECKNNSRYMGYPATDCKGDYYLRTRNESKFVMEE
ncbi:lipase member H-like [Epargyreus clarus]|uniref:lipase member H-like n=1 Tax=Epargyreus clarus TaxID=520877 RepID=UPI003C30E4CE